MQQGRWGQHPAKHTDKASHKVRHSSHKQPVEKQNGEWLGWNARWLNLARLTSRVELLRLKLLLALPAPPELLPPPAAVAAEGEVPESVERRGMGASTLKKRLSTKTVWIQARVRCGFLQARPAQPPQAGAGRLSRCSTWTGRGCAHAAEQHSGERLCAGQQPLSTA